MVNSEKINRYEELLLQVRGLTDGETSQVSVLANVAAAIHAAMDFWWTGFYLVSGDQLILGPFQGPVACYRIKRGRGVCGSAWERGETLVVPDVEQFPGHIACSSESRSEIVVPVLDSSSQVCAVLDIDSRSLAAFDQTDAHYLGIIAQIVSDAVFTHSLASQRPPV